jgi:hypothetical protein
MASMDTLAQAMARRRRRITEDDPRWNAATMGNRTGYYKGTYYERGKKSRGARNYNKGNLPG